MGAVGRTVTGARASTASLVREPFTLALLVVLPAVSVQIYGVGLGQFDGLSLFAPVESLVATGRITGAVFATGALAGVFGLFGALEAREADRRLALAGFRGVELVATRVATVLAVSAVVAAVGTATLVALLARPVGWLPGVFAGLALAGVVYGLLGVLAGSLLSRELEGSLLLVFLADVDNVFASGLFAIDESVTRFAPLTHPHELVTRAVFEGALATDHLLPAFGHVAVVGAAAVATYTVRVGNGGGGR